MISSTWSSESAPRSSTKEASGATSSASTPNCSTMIDLTLSSTDIGLSSIRFDAGYLRADGVLAHFRDTLLTLRPFEKDLHIRGRCSTLARSAAPHQRRGRGGR